MAARLKDFSSNAIKKSTDEDYNLRLDCTKRFHQCIQDTIHMILEHYAKEGKTNAIIPLSGMNLINTCNPVAEKVMDDYQESSIC